MGTEAGRSKRLGALLRFAQWMVGAAALFALLRFVAGAPLDWATLWLVVAGLALFQCLRALFRMVFALTRPDVHTVVEQEIEFAKVPDRHLREEKRRLLRALNELKFDFEMGKLSQEDYDDVREAYELGAVEVLRQLEGGRELHPDLRRRLADIDGAAGKGGTKRASYPRSAPGKGEMSAHGASEAGATATDSSKNPASTAEAGATTTDSSKNPARTTEAGLSAEGSKDAASAAEGAETAARKAAGSKAADGTGPASGDAAVVCRACDGHNDRDARFCKLCGKELAA